MDIRDIRRAHLESHIAKFENAERFLAALNDRLQNINEKEMTSSYLSQLRVGPPKGRNIGHTVARRLEVALSLAPGSLDAPIEQKVTQLDEEAQAISELWKGLPPNRRAVAKQTILALSQEPEESE